MYRIDVPEILTASLVVSRSLAGILQKQQPVSLAWKERDALKAQLEESKKELQVQFPIRAPRSRLNVAVSLNWVSVSCVSW